MAADWFRNEAWSPEIEQAFQAKLARCRTQGPQYLYLQALALSDAGKEPEVSLRLVDQYIATGDTFRMAGCFEVQAKVYLSLGLIEPATDAYKRALNWEALSPGPIGRAGFELPYLIATRGQRNHYEAAISLLQSPKLQLVFPVDRFMHACSLALIYSDRGDSTLAMRFANEALDAAATSKSPFPRHPGIGLVGNRYAPEIVRLKSLVGAGYGLFGRLKAMLN